MSEIRTIGPEHASQRWGELPRSLRTLVILAAVLYALAAVWRPLGWVVVAYNAVFVVPTVLQTAFEVVGFPFVWLSGGLRKGELRWALSAVVAASAHTAVEGVWMFWAVTHLLRG